MNHHVRLFEEEESERTNNESRAWQVGNNVLDPQEAVSVARRQMMQHSRGVLAHAKRGSMITEY